MFRRPVHEIARWPAWEVGLLEEYLAVVPGPDERVEIAIAQFMALYINSKRTSKDQQTYKIDDFLMFRRGWNEEAPEMKTERYSELDMEIMGIVSKQ